MLLEYSFTGFGENQHKPCYVALCDDDDTIIKTTVTDYWKKHGINCSDYGKFIFHRNENEEFVAMVACTEINAIVMEYALESFQSWLGIRISVPDLIEITNKFQKDLETNE